jgi:isopentenyl-diphosphate Delta-isomerase
MIWVRDSSYSEVILVDSTDQQVGVMEKLTAHRLGVLHRAFSIFLFNSKGELLLQKRAEEKYHSAGLWSNTCCSHPSPGQSVVEAAKDRLFEEMGLRVDLVQVFGFLYCAPVGHDLIENEYDHVVIGVDNQIPEINPQEVSAYKWVNLDCVVQDVQQHPEKYTKWLVLLLQNQFEKIQQSLKSLHESLQKRNV